MDLPSKLHSADALLDQCTWQQRRRIVLALLVLRDVSEQHVTTMLKIAFSSVGSDGKVTT